MNAIELRAKIEAHAVAIQEDIDAFCAAEVAAGGGNTPSTAYVTATDILYKYLEMGFKDTRRENINLVPTNYTWQASDLVVYQKSDATMINLKIEDYSSKIARTGRHDEDRKGYIPLAEKTAADMGYTTPKAHTL